MAVPVLEVVGLTVAYQTEAGVLEAVRDVDLTIHKRQSFGLVGESGSGKSTLAMAAIRYLADNGRIVRGSIRLNGQELQDLSPKELRQIWGAKVGMVYQSPLTALNPSIAIGRQLAEVARIHLGMSRSAADERVLEMLRTVAMPDPESVARRYPHQLSGGMLQRCVIAMALMTNPELLILDEPTTALDVTTQAVVLDLVATLKREFDSAILYITHDLGVVARICDQIGVMYAGEFFEQCAVHPLFTRPRHPYTLDLLGCVPRFEPGRVRRPLTTIPGYIPRLDELPTGCVFAPRCAWVEDACRAARPPLREVGVDHLSACRRWQVVPAPADRSVGPADAGALADAGAGARLLEARDVKVTFAAPGAALSFPRRGARKTVKAVDGMTLFVNEGRTLGVVGESGSGKTTMARAVIGLVEPCAGEITLCGRPLERSTAKRPREVLKRIQMVFQNPDASLNPQRSVGAAIARPLTLLTGADRSEVRKRVLALLEAVHLPSSYYERLPGELSGGEKQRVAIARAFAAEPDLVLCDEPISSLDVSVQGSLMNLLMDLQAEKDTSYLFISHDLAAVQHLSDWIAVVYLGLIMELGDSDRVLLPPYHPYTEALLSAIPVADPDIEQKAIRLEGGVPSALDIPPGCRFHTRCPRFLGDICREQEPPWRLGEGDHWIYCHIPLDELSELQAETIRFSGGGA